ncbi:MAG: hypothetical protein WBW48_20080 [Anaerolineae bacterium]
MHRIARLDPSLRSGVRTEVFRVLAEYASGGNHGPIPIKRLFLRAADGLAETGIIEKPKFLRGQKFVQLADEGRSQLFPDYGIPGDIANLMRQTFWELYLQGVLAPATRKDPGEELLYFDSVMLTPYGVGILIDVRNRIQVHDPDGYLANFWGARPEPDPEMMRYLVECVWVFRSGHLLATVVLLGIASERLIEVLALSLREALGKSYGGATWFRDKYERNPNISDRFKAVESKLMGEYGKELDEEKLKDGFQTIVKLTFEMIRDARNAIAHPKGRDFTWNEVGGLLHNLVPYFRHINAIIAFLAAHPR